MIAIAISGQQYQVPTSWRDITYKKYCDIITFNGDSFDFLSLLSGIPCNTLKNIDDESILMLTELFTFVQDQTFLEKFNFVPFELEAFDIGKESWYKIEKAKQEIAKHEKFICSAAGIIKVYLEKEIKDEPIHKVWGQVNFFLSEINKFFERYKRLSESEEDEDEFIAGVKRFEQFGFFCQCVELSRKMNKTYDEVLAMSANDIYRTFLYDFEKADYEKALYRIKSRKK